MNGKPSILALKQVRKHYSRSVSLILIFFFAFSIVDNAESKLSDNAVGLTYPVARDKLIREGFTPLRVKTHDAVACLGSEDVCSKFPETIRCAGADVRPCLFLWEARNNKMMVVYTVGEDIKNLRVTLIGPLYSQQLQ